MSTERFRRFSEMTWPKPDADLAWRLRFEPESISERDRVFLASVLDAYRELISTNRLKREMVCRELRDKPVSSEQKG